MKKKLIKAGILAAVFLVALVAGSLMINRGTEDRIVDMGAPSIPRLSFLAGDQKVNPLCGYAREMDIPLMRDTITPLGENGELTVNIESGGDRIGKLRYKVCSPDGKTVYKDGEKDLSEQEEGVILDLGEAFTRPLQERNLVITLEMEDGEEVYYYTRVILPDTLVVSDSIAFARDFHSKALAKDREAGLENYLEPGDQSDNTTYQTVNIHSDLTHILWGEFSPRVIGDVEWNIQESNSVYTSLLAAYQIACEDGDGASDVYNVREFFRVRSVEGTIYLLDYNRNMEKIFSETEAALSEEGIEIGIASSDIQYMTNEDETMIAFVQERELWLYDTEASRFTNIFSFADQEGSDVRSRNDRHTVRITGVDESGDVSFIVCGYMNRGIHEGEVGIGVYYFDKAQSVLQEKAFLSGTGSPAVMEKTFGEMVYYAHGRDVLYTLIDGTIYEIDIEKDEHTVLAELLEEEDFVLSGDGRMLAYATAEEGIRVVDLETGESHVVEAREGEQIRPLGFINRDFVYGKIHPTDEGQDESGNTLLPMYEMEILNSGNEKEATYTFVDQGLYITGITIEDNLMTVERVQKTENLYRSGEPEYIANNTGRKETAVSADVYSTQDKGRQLRISLPEGAGGSSPEFVKADYMADGKTLELVLDKETKERRYLVYGMGDLEGIYETAGDAVQAAEQVSGVVVTSDQSYVWERGNRNLAYDTGTQVFSAEEGETSAEACQRYMQSYDAAKVDLTGCTLEQVLYEVSRGCPVIARISADHSVLVSGYTLSEITYIDPELGETVTVPVETMRQMTQTAGNVFTGYVRQD